jgi:hypothetical protein
MVVNALTATNGTAADCHQQIKLNFLVGTAISSVNLLDPETGVVTTNVMPVVGGSGSGTRRQLILELDGGDTVLFKFADGAPFVGYVAPSPPQILMQSAGTPPSIRLQGAIGAHYLLQTATSLPANDWVTLTNFLLPSSPYVFQDAVSPASVQRYYRAVGVP